MDFERDYDAVIAGGGVAGIAAALASARSGLKTALVEKTVLTGGLATAGLINIFLPLCDGNGTQVTSGIAEEMLHASIRYGPGEVPPGWRGGKNAREEARYRVVFSPASFALALDELLEAAGVAVMLDTRITRPVVEGGVIAGVEVENASGRGRLLAKVAVDATGDATVAARAGCECELGGNWMSMWALGASIEQARRAAESGSCEAFTATVRLGVPEAGGKTSGATETFAGADEITRFVLGGRRALREHYAARHADPADGADRSTCFPVALPTLPQLRTIRRIVGRASLSDGDDHTRFEDSVGLVADWRISGPVWEIPYGALVPGGVKGLLAAGRCISSEGDAWEVTRVIPACALTGEAAGVAAAISVREGAFPDEIDPAAVQRGMRERGIPLHLEDVGLSGPGEGAGE